MIPLLDIPLEREQDVVIARQRTREVAELLGLDRQDQTRLAAAVSEIARNAYRYAGRGMVVLAIDAGPRRAALAARISDDGPGIQDLQAILEGRHRSAGAMAGGITSARRLADAFEIDSAPGRGTRVVLRQFLADGAAPTGTAIETLRSQVRRLHPPSDLLEELQNQNRELLRALQGERERQEELQQLNQELEDTNRGVLALYAELDARAEQLRHADRMKSRFLSHMSHEFRTPLNSILALSRLLLGRYDGALTPGQDEQVRLIETSARDLVTLVDDLLDLAKVEAGRLELKVGTFEVRNLFGALRGMFRPLLSSDKVVLTFDEPPGLPPLHTDEAKLSQILRNLVSNALKFTVAGEIRVSATLAEDGETIAFSVADTGIGIAPQDCAHVFEDFAQLDHPLQRKVRGTGLGLPLSRRLAELLGGTLSVESELGRGSTFTASIPCWLPGEAAAEPAPARTGRPVALVIDDDPETRSAVRDRLTALGFDVVEAADGHVGLEAALRHAPELVLVDLSMPRLDGLSMIERFRENRTGARTAIGVMTGAVPGPAVAERLARLSVPLGSKDLLQSEEGFAEFVRGFGITAGPLLEGENP